MCRLPLNNDVKSLVVIAMEIREQSAPPPPQSESQMLYQRESDSLNGMEECCRGAGERREG